MKTIIHFPYYAKVTLVVTGIFVFISMLSVAQDIIVPVLFATLVAIFLSPIVNFMVKHKINRGTSIALIMLVSTMGAALLIAFLSWQIGHLYESMPALKIKFHQLGADLTKWLSDYFNIEAKQISVWTNNLKNELSSSRGLLGATLTTTHGMLTAAVLTPVYIFMLLLYQPHLVEFIHALFGSRNDTKVNEILTESKTIIQRYVVGLFIEFFILTILNTAGLLLLGIDYAVLLGITGALLNTIPYLGGIIAMVCFALMAFVTKTPWHVLYVLVMYTVIQFIDNNYIVPKIIGSKVKLNAFVCLLAVVAGAALWGLPGMFLSIPLTAIAKVVADRIDHAKPWGTLLGQTTTIIVKPK